MYIHKHIHVYKYIYICVCACAKRARERERDMRDTKKGDLCNKKKHALYSPATKEHATGNQNPEALSPGRYGAPAQLPRVLGQVLVEQVGL